MYKVYTNPMFIQINANVFLFGINIIDRNLIVYKWIIIKTLKYNGHRSQCLMNCQYLE